MRRWTAFSVLQQALSDFCQAQGLGRTMPTESQLEAAGRHDLIVAIGKFGGYATVAERLNLVRVDRRRRKAE